MVQADEQEKVMTPPAAPFGEVDALYEKATKGPWRVGPDRDRAGSYFIQGYSGLVAHTYESNISNIPDGFEGGHGDATDANPHLIAALFNAYPALKAAHAAAATAARNDALEEAARVVEMESEEDGEPEQLRNLVAAIRALKAAR